MIPLTDCIPRGVYRISSRNLGIGVFNGDTGFVGARYKWGYYLFTEYHRDTGTPLGTVAPKELLHPLPDEFNLNEDSPELLKYLMDLEKLYGDDDDEQI